MNRLFHLWVTGFDILQISFLLYSIILESISSLNVWFNFFSEVFVTVLDGQNDAIFTFWIVNLFQRNRSVKNNHSVENKLTNKWAILSRQLGLLKWWYLRVDDFDAILQESFHEFETCQTYIYCIIVCDYKHYTLILSLGK